MMSLSMLAIKPWRMPVKPNPTRSVLLDTQFNHDSFHKTAQPIGFSGAVRPALPLRWRHQDNGIFELDLTSHQPLLSRLGAHMKRKYDKADSTFQQTEPRHEFRLDKRPGKPIRVRYARSEMGAALTPEDKTAMTRLVGDMVRTMETDGRLKVLLGEDVRRIGITLKAYRGVGDPSRHPFHTHDESVFSGIIGLSPKADYKNGELVVARGTHVAYDLEMPIKHKTPGRTTYPRIGSLGYGDIKPGAPTIFYNQKPDVGKIIVWPEARAERVFPEAKYIEHAVTPLLGKRYVAIVSAV